LPHEESATCPTALFQPARLELRLLDPQVARELGIIAADLLDAALDFLAADERLDGVSERKDPGLPTAPV
jgi:hypothetical protein